MISIFRNICKGEQIVLLDYFNLNQMLQEDINRLVPLKDIFNSEWCSRYSTHQVGQIFDIVFDFKVIKTVSWVSSPFFHFTLSFIFHFRSLKGIYRISKIGTAMDKKREKIDMDVVMVMQDIVDR